jgi:hypothetical protein
MSGLRATIDTDVADVSSPRLRTGSASLAAATGDGSCNVVAALSPRPASRAEALIAAKLQIARARSALADAACQGATPSSATASPRSLDDTAGAEDAPGRAASSSSISSTIGRIRSGAAAMRAHVHKGSASAPVSARSPRGGSGLFVRRMVNGFEGGADPLPPRPATSAAAAATAVDAAPLTPGAAAAIAAAEAAGLGDPEAVMDVVRQLAAARVALAERDSEVEVLHTQTRRLADRLDRLSTCGGGGGGGGGAGAGAEAEVRLLTEQVMGRSAELAEARAEMDELGCALADAEAALSAARGALEDERRAAAMLARQVDVLRVVLADHAAAGAAAAAAAAAREEGLAGQLAEQRGRAEAAEAGLARAAADRAAMAARLDEAQRELRKLTGSGLWVGDASEAGRELLLQHRAEAAAEKRAEDLTTILMEREEELAYYRRHCTALEGHVSWREGRGASLFALGYKWSVLFSCQAIDHSVLFLFLPNLLQNPTSCSRHARAPQRPSGLPPPTSSKPTAWRSVWPAAPHPSPQPPPRPPTPQTPPPPAAARPSPGRLHPLVTSPALPPLPPAPPLPLLPLLQRPAAAASWAASPRSGTAASAPPAAAAAPRSSRSSRRPSAACGRSCGRRSARCGTPWRRSAAPTPRSTASRSCRSPRPPTPAASKARSGSSRPSCVRRRPRRRGWRGSWRRRRARRRRPGRRQRRRTATRRSRRGRWRPRACRCVSCPSQLLGWLLLRSLNAVSLAPHRNRLT